MKKTIQNILNIKKEKINKSINDFMNSQLKNYREKYKNWSNEYQEFLKRKNKVFEKTNPFKEENQIEQKTMVEELKEDEFNLFTKAPILNFLPKHSQFKEIILLTANDEKK